MVFNSYIFILLFLPTVIIGYYGLNHFKLYKLSKIFLIIMSLWFYSYTNIKYIAVLFLSIIVNYCLCCILVDNKQIKLGGATGKKSRKIILIIGLVFNIGTLIYYKYFNFFVENINVIFSTNFNYINLILPLGISFITFQHIAYLIDCYKGEEVRYNFSDFFLSVVFFPKILSGPIVFHHEIIPQFLDTTKKNFNYECFAKGLVSFSFGMAKKVLLADNFGKIVTWGWDSLETLDSTNAILVMLAYTMQIYFDFSGYSDMAVGIGRMLRIEMINNFSSPYKALTPAEFWKFWHISLTRFFTRYLYIPLGGNRKGKIRTYINNMIVFLVSGFWHGANWTFILWGLMHGVAIVINRIFKEKIKTIHPALLWIVTFSFINIAWIYFRAPSISEGTLLVKKILYCDFSTIDYNIVQCFDLPELEVFLGILGLSLSPYIVIACFAITVCAVLYTKNTSERLDSFKANISMMIIIPFLLIWSILSFSGVSTFLYVNF